MARLTMEFAVDIEDGDAQTWKRRLTEDAKYALLVVDDGVFSTTLMMEPVEGEWNLVEDDATSAATCAKLRASAEGERCPTAHTSK